MTGPLALDTSVALPLLITTHNDHDLVVRWLNGRSVVLSGHALAETYSVLTRLRGGNARTPAEAVALIDSWFGPAATVEPETVRSLPRLFAAAGIHGGAVYDALVALAARENGLVLGTRDRQEHNV